MDAGAYESLLLFEDTVGADISHQQTNELASSSRIWRASYQG
jgi:hypothetical protein